MDRWNKIKIRAIEGKLFQNIKILKQLKLGKVAKILDKYFGWLVRTFWNRETQICHNKILFISFNKLYTCNPKYICQEIIRRNLDYELIWLISPNDRSAFPACVKRIPIGTVAAYREMCSAQIIIENAHLSQEIGYITLPKEQYRIQTWHGSLGIKQFGPAFDSVKSRVKAAKRAGKLNNLFLSNSHFETTQVAPVFWHNSEICEWGHARNDILFHQDPIQLENIRSRLSIGNCTKVALYAPTYRDSKDLNHYNIDYERLRCSLHTRFGGDWVILVKLHTSMRRYAEKLQYSNQVINVSQYNDIQELMLISDVAITDYSSWIFDFVLMKKPAFLYADDIQDYEAERGLYYPLYTTPFPVSSTNEELENNIINFDSEKYLKNVDQFLKRMGCVEDGYAAKRVVDRIEEIMKCYIAQFKDEVAK